MDANWLTVKLVEDIQEAVALGVDVFPTVAGLRGGTLPGIVEYGCLRWAIDSSSIPPLPAAITSSPLVEALKKERSELGLRSKGAKGPLLKRIDPKEAEFCTIATEAELDEQPWELFRTRFARSARTFGIADSVADKLALALDEMAENAVVHAKTTVAALAGYRVMPGIAQFCVADVGIGVLESLTSCDDYRYLQTHNEAIREALHDGTTCYGRGKGGLGFRSVFKSLVAQWGILRFRSGNGCISMDGADLDSDKGEKANPPQLPGFQVTVCCQSGPDTSSEPLV